MTGTLVLLRHGASEWSEQSRFTGRVDIPLSRRGVEQAKRAGRLMRAAGLVPDAVRTSTLRRAEQTAAIALAELGTVAPEVRRDARLDERHYGELQGRLKREVALEFGEEQYLQWRRAFDAAPPGGESLRDVLERVLRCWSAEILPRLVAGERVLVVSHSNVVRAFIKHLDDLDDDQIAEVNVPTGNPLVYEVGAESAHRVGYLDAVAARESVRAIAREGLDEPEGPDEPDEPGPAH